MWKHSLKRSAISKSPHLVCKSHKLVINVHYFNCKATSLIQSPLIIHNFAEMVQYKYFVEKVLNFVQNHPQLKFLAMSPIVVLIS